VANARNALYAGNGIAFEQHGKHQLGLLERDVHAVQVVFTRLPKEFGALAALIPLVPLAVASLRLHSIQQL
jgi:hypothetical protein